jgi:hypothetical protein
MAEHRFRVGERVRIVRSTDVNAIEVFVTGSGPRDTSNVWTVERLLPADRRGPQYRVHADSGASRVVHEHDLERA